MKPVIPVLSLLLLLLLATTTQGIRLDKESLAAFHDNIHEKESSMGGVMTKVAGVVPCGINGHCSGRGKKLVDKTMATVKNERSEETVFDAAQSHHHSKEAIDSSGEELHVEPPVSNQPQTYPDTLDIAGMDYSPAKRNPPIHN